MAVTPAVFTIAGGGRLNPAWFAGAELDDLLSMWIDLAGEGSDQLVTARVYFRAFTFLADQVQARPSTQRDRTKTSQWTTDQLAYWQRQATAYQEEIDALTGVFIGPVLTRWT